ncbi:thioredoxin TrxA [Candidatus Williamhamiltonella defendens]|uniref:thioredoxin TrxA n=1 Tax=Candidatus Williamhamiltonella defendens TaxID=138072 RepID=UPI00130D7922|nr:thioredoxin TrxA [Candidatus Hamiltonella defensa]
MSKEIIQLSDKSFDQDVLKGAGFILVDFWAQWCGPCKTIASILDEISNEYLNKITFTKLEIDINPNTTQKYGIRSIPTLLLFKEGKPIDTKVGAVSKHQLKNFLDTHIGNFIN